MTLESNQTGPLRRVRFVVLLHVQRDGEHFDLMIEQPGRLLASWRMPSAPERAMSIPLTCVRIGDHREIYLEYEGPVSGDRGHVTRHDAGWCIPAQQDERLWRVRFEGSRLAGEFVLEQLGQSETDWRLRAISE